MGRGRKKHQAYKGEMSSKSLEDQWRLARYGNTDPELVDLIFLVRSNGTTQERIFASFPEIEQRVREDDRQNEERLAALVLQAVRCGNAKFLHEVAVISERCAAGLMPADKARLLIADYVFAWRSGVTPNQIRVLITSNDPKMVLRW